MSEQLPVATGTMLSEGMILLISLDDLGNGKVPLGGNQVPGALVSCPVIGRGVGPLVGPRYSLPPGVVIWLGLNVKVVGRVDDLLAMDCPGTLSVPTTVFVTRFLKVTVMAWLVGLYTTKELVPPLSLNAP